MLLVFSAPSGSGKSTLINYLMQQGLNLKFSVSATSRAPRGTEKNGVEYFFLTPEEFRTKIAENAFVEYEEVYKDKFYGTLKSEVDRMLNDGDNVVLDVDVKGALNIKKMYGDKAFLVFIQPPSVEELRKRLVGRNTDSAEVIEQRLRKASYELSFAGEFDAKIVNGDLHEAEEQLLKTVRERLGQEV
jgi:guanylate kinase